jgi:AAT family amino acid transporter
MPHKSENSRDDTARLAAPDPRSMPGAIESTDALGKHLKPRHLVMMSLGCAIGTGLFVGMGKGIATAGPAVLLAFALASFLIILIIRMLGEMAAANPNSGALSVYVGRAMGPTAGVTLGWLWWAAMVVSIAAEATAAATILHSLWPSLPQWGLALTFMGIFTAMNLAGVSKFGEMEFWFAALKIGAIIIFLGVGVAILLGAMPNAESPGLSNLFDHGGFMPNGISGIGAALLIVIFTFGGTEIVAIAAAETEDPKKNIARATRSVIYRILIFFVGSVVIMVTVLPWHSKELQSGPFVAVLKFAGIPGIDLIMALVIATALLSSLNANLYAASRMIFSLSKRGSAPQRFSTVSKNKVPRAAVVASVAFGFVAVLLNYLWPETILFVLLNTVGSVNLLLWVAAVLAHIVLRRRADRDPTIQLPLKMWAFPYLSYLAAALLAGIFALALLDAASRTQILATSALASVIALIYWVRHKRLGSAQVDSSQPVPTQVNAASTEATSI